MKRLMFAGLGALWLTTFTPLPGHAWNHHEPECDDKHPDVAQDVRDINEDQFELQRAILTGNQKKAERIRRELAGDRKDLEQDRDCNEVSEEQ